MTAGEQIPELKTPRTRNRLFDNSQPMASPEGYSGNDWTFRKQLEADFRALGFRSHKFSHKNEPSERFADSLWFSWNFGGKVQPAGASVSDIEARVTFISHEGPFFTERETTVTITHEGWSSGGCMPRRMGKAIFLIDSRDSGDVLAHVRHLISKPRIR